ncbi:MAG: pyrophosphatase, partial [candidate division Zixibacteria bacterium DG_27]
MNRFERLVKVMARLRSPDGCPWDLRQDHQSLKPYLIEEAYEVIEAIDSGDDWKLKEELGDLLLQI